HTHQHTHTCIRLTHLQTHTETHTHTQTHTHTHTDTIAHQSSPSFPPLTHTHTHSFLGELLTELLVAAAPLLRLLALLVVVDGQLLQRLQDRVHSLLRR